MLASVQDTPPTKVLLIEDNPTDARRILAALAGGKDAASPFDVEWASQLTQGLERLQRCRAHETAVEVVLLDLELSSEGSISAFEQIIQAAPDALILVLSESSDEADAQLAAQLGAKGYIPKSQVDTYWLPRALKYVIELKAAERVVREAEEALFEERERAQVTLNSIGDGVIATDTQSRVTYLNQVAETMTGWSSANATGRPLPEVFRIISKSTQKPSENPAILAIQENRIVGLSSDCVLIRSDGFECAIEDSVAPIHNRHGQVTGAVIVFRDVSQSRALSIKMSHMAQHDILTGLPNRMLLTEHFTLAIGLAQRHHKQVALMFIDLDYFKHINDSLGHTIGDLLLQSVAKRLVQCVRATDTVCRQGGDEFVILLSEIEQPQDAAHIAETLHKAFSAPQDIDGHELHISLSTGISIYPDDGISVVSLMQNADTAMYHAKALGRNNYQFFRADMNIRAVQRMLIENNLRRALQENEFRLYYQPKIDLTTGSMVGAEALIRWQDPDLGLVLPDQFITIAEECGLIVPIGRWVMREACRQVQAWLDAGLNAVPVAINISAAELKHKDFLQHVIQTLKETGLAPRHLEMELTESILMRNAEASATLLVALKSLGIHLSIDNFGTGYSSLSYLKRFPIDTLKIDQSFVRDITTDADDATIVAAIICMGKHLRQNIIAEGVETPEQLALLLSQQCDQAQGYNFSHPLSSQDFTLLLASPRSFLH